ncbi:MAG: hypothetical protein BM485_08965 [Desulfobulbaceae bacterium DB1]|nr:MAG: hypothetical protein BM485_08965 [Desulfobulbaceae bacterium DB1]
MFAEFLPLWMFVALTVLLMAGFPVAFTLLGTSLVFGFVGFGWNFFNLLPLRIWGIMNNSTLLAVPLFVFMGVMLERSGLAERLLDTMALIFGRMRGGLAVSVVMVGALLGASTGIVGATVVTMGLLAVPAMLRRGYQKELACGTVAASGTLGQIIPPQHRFDSDRRHRRRAGGRSFSGGRAARSGAGGALCSLYCCLGVSKSRAGSRRCA